MLWYTNYIQMKGRHTKLKKKISICLVSFLIALTVCLSLSEGIHSNHNCKQEQCVFCIEIKQLKTALNQMRAVSAIWTLALISLYAGMLYVFEREQEQPSLVKWKVRMDH